MFGLLGRSRLQWPPAPSLRLVHGSAAGMCVSAAQSHRLPALLSSQRTLHDTASLLPSSWPYPAHPQAFFPWQRCLATKRRAINPFRTQFYRPSWKNSILLIRDSPPMLLLLASSVRFSGLVGLRRLSGVPGVAGSSSPDMARVLSIENADQVTFCRIPFNP